MSLRERVAKDPWLAVAWSPLSRLLATTYLGTTDWIVALAAVLWPVLLMQALKAWGSAAAVGHGHPTSDPAPSIRPRGISRSS